MNPLLDMDLTGKRKAINPLLDLDLSTYTPDRLPEPTGANLNWWDDQMKPTLLETGKQIFEIPKSIGEVAATTVTGGLGWLVGSGLGIAESLKPGSTRESVNAVREDAAGRLTYQPRTQPAAILMERAGKGIEAVLGPAKEAAALVGESWSSPFLESVLRFVGEAATFEAMGSAGKGKIKTPEWYRRMSVKERGLVEGMKADIANGEFTTAQIRELWKDPANRAELLKRYQGIGVAEKPSASNVQTILDEIIPPERALPAGQGFELRPRPDEVQAILDEMIPPTKALPYPEGVGEGFTSTPGEAEPPIVTKAGQPFKTEKTATQAGKGLDWNLYEVTPQGEGFAITRKMGKEIRPESAVEVPAEPEIVKPGPTSGVFPAKGANIGKGPQNIVTLIQKMGGLNVYDDYNAPEMRQFPDLDRVMKKSGLKPDEIAMALNDEGVVSFDGQPFTGDSLVEYLKSGQARDILTPEKQDLIIERRLRRQENEWISQQLAELETEGIDSGAVEASSGDIKAGLIEAAKAEGYSEAEALDALDFPFRVKEGTPNRLDSAYRLRDEQKRFPRSYEDSYYGGPPRQFKSYSEEELGGEPARAPAPINNRAITKVVTDKPWKWTANDLMDLKPSERQAKLDKIWGPKEEFEDWFEGGEGPDKKRYWVLVDHAADLDRAIADGDGAEISAILSDIQSRLAPHEYYAYEEVQNARRNASVPGNADRTPTEQIPATERANTPAKSDKYNQESLPGLSDRETFILTNPETEHGKLISKDKGPQTGTFDLFSERGSTGDLSESEILQAILKTRGKVEQAMPHLEALGKSVYESGKTRFLEWQAAIKNKLGDLWESFKAHLKGVFERLQSGEVGPMKNQKGAVGVDINDPVIKQREIKDAKTGEVRMAPTIHRSEFEAVFNMPELRQKPLGGWLENPIRTFEELGGNVKELFYRPMKEGEHLAKKHFQRIFTKSESIRKSLPGKASERIGTYAISQQRGGADILDAMGIKEIPQLTPEEMKAYNWMRGGLETFYNKLQEARAKAGKEGFGHVENYFTFARQFTLMEKLGFSPIFSRLALLQNVFHRKTTPFAFEKHRVGGLSRADLDAFGVFNRYMESATRHYYLSPAIAKGREMLLTFKLDDTKWILRDEKPGSAKFITEWLDYQAGQRKPQLPNLIEKGLTKLNKNLAFSILSANIRSALIQPTALVNTVAEIGPRWTYEGVKSILDTSGYEKSNVLLSRQFDINVTESLAGLPGKLGKAKQTVGNAAMKPLQWLDMQTARATWNGAYKKGLSEKMGEEQARNYADDVVTKTQGSAMPSDLSPAQRTALGKSLTMFQTFVINQWGFLTRDVLGIHNASIKNPQVIKKVLTWIAGATLVNSFYEDIIGVPSPLPSPISAFIKALDKGDDFPSASLDAAAEIVSLVPIVGGGVRYGSSMLGAPAEYIGDIGKKLAPNYVGPTRSAAELVAKGLGVPGTGQLVKSAKIAKKGGSAYDIIVGRYPDENKGGRLVNTKLKGLGSGKLKGLK